VCGRFYGFCSRNLGASSAGAVPDVTSRAKRAVDEKLCEPCVCVAWRVVHAYSHSLSLTRHSVLSTEVRN
jgi:hypothetical protein